MICGDNITVEGVTITGFDGFALIVEGNNAIISNVNITDCGENGVVVGRNNATINSIIANNHKRFAVLPGWLQQYYFRNYP